MFHYWQQQSSQKFAQVNVYGHTYFVIDDCWEEAIGLEGRAKFDLGVHGKQSFLHFSPLAARHIETWARRTLLSAVLEGGPDRAVHNTVHVSGWMHKVEVLASTFCQSDMSPCQCLSFSMLLRNHCVRRMITRQILHRILAVPQLENWDYINIHHNNTQSNV